MYLTFSDAAKFAEAARSYFTGQGLTIHHSFFSQPLLASYTPGQSWAAGFMPLPSLVLFLVFRIFPANQRKTMRTAAVSAPDRSPDQLSSKIGLKAEKPSHDNQAK